MKALFITQKADRDDPVLGFMHAWFEGLATRLDALHLLVLEPGNYDLPGNVFVHSMGKERGAGRVGKLLNFASVMFALVLRRRVDVVFAHMCPIYAALAAPFCRVRGVPLLMWITHGADNPTLRLAHRLADRVLTASPESTALAGPKVTATGHGIDTAKFSASGAPGADPLRVLSVGRVTQSKDYPTLIEAARILIHERGVKNFRVSIVGACYTEDDKKHLDELKHLLQEKDVADYITFEGAAAHDAMPEQYGRADVFVSASLTGSVDKAVLEAMACGRPAITCNPSFHRVFEDMADALMFAPGDAAKLADILQRFLSATKEDRARTGAILRALVQRNHSLETLMDRLVHEMKKCAYLKKGRSPRTDWLAARARGGLILDIGFAGAAFPVLHFSIMDLNPDSRVVGCDLFYEKILAQKFTTGVCGDAMRLPFGDNTFDSAVFAEIYEHLVEPAAALRELARVLRPGGRLVFSSPSAYAPLKWVRDWLLAPRPWDMRTVRRHLTDPDHVQFADPISLFRLLDELGLTVTEAITKKHRIPLLGRLTRRADTFNIPFYPFTRLGGALCLVAEKKTIKNG